MRGRGVLATVVALALIGAGCGSASSSSTTQSHGANNATTGTGATGTTGTTGSVIPAGSVAVAAGTPITQGALDHWMSVAAKSQAAQTPGQPVIVPTDPPAFKACIANVRSQIPTMQKTADKTLQADCAQLYKALSNQVMSFLIQADWIQADGRRFGVTPSDAQVNRTLTTLKNKQFPGGKGYQTFLAKSGETAQDIVFRVRVNVTMSRLTAREKGSATVKQNAVTTREKRLYLAGTRCAPLVAMADCAGYTGG